MGIGFLLPVFGAGPGGGSDTAGDVTTFQVGFEVGFFARFFMETEEKDLIGTDFRVGIPLSLASGGWAARLEARHTSSHLGDDILDRFPQEVEKVGYEGFELTLARTFFPALRGYVGGEFNWEKEEIVERTAARVGLELDPTLAGPVRRVAGFVAADLRMTEKTERVEGTAVAGVVLPIGAVRFRVEARGHVGPSPFGQFRLVDEPYVGLGLRIETGRAPVP